MRLDPNPYCLLFIEYVNVKDKMQYVKVDDFDHDICSVINEGLQIATFLICYIAVSHDKNTVHITKLNFKYMFGFKIRYEIDMVLRCVHRVFCVCLINY